MHEAQHQLAAELDELVLLPQLHLPVMGDR
jgi:hypothetical protein